MITENLSTLKINKLTQAQYDRELAAGTIDENALYLTPEEAIDLSPYATIEQLNEEVENITTNYETKSNVDTKINTHNTSTSSHSDIRTLISDLSTKVGNFLDVDDTTADQLSEVIAMIEANEGTIESLTSNKVNVADIIDNLTTASADKVLSANQGVVLKALIDALQTELDEHTHTVSEITDLTATATELNYMDGVTSNVQTQLDSKSDSAHDHNSLYYTKTEIDSIELITVDDIDTICGSDIVAANEVTY